MPKVTEADILKPQGITCWINGPAGSGKTRLAMGFPDVFAVTFDPTGLDLLKEPSNANIRGNLRWHVPMNGLALAPLFKFTEEADENSLYGAIALAKDLAKKGEIKTFLLDGFTYLAQLKWTQICEVAGIDPNQKETMDKKQFDSQKMYDALGSYLDHLILQNVFPLATRQKLNVIITCHLQRESKNTVEGFQSSRSSDQERTAKRLVNLDSDLAPQVLGSFRQRIDGLPSANIYLEHRIVAEGDPPVEKLKYIAYCRMTKSESFDTIVRAKNRFGLGTLNLTDASFYKTLLRKLEDQQQSQPKSEPKTDATAPAAASKTKS